MDEHIKEIKTISIIGAGAMGAAYAGMFYTMDNDCISIIAGNKRYEKLNNADFVINDKKYNFKIINVNEINFKPDLIIVAVKYYDLNEAINDLKNFITGDTIILSIMNGIDSEEILKKAFPQTKIPYSIVLGIDAVRENNKIMYAHSGKIYFGNKNNFTLSEEVISIKNLFNRAKIEYEIPEDMLKILWWKFMINTGINQPSAIMNAPYDVFQKIEEAGRVMEASMREVILIAQKKGIDLKEDDITGWRKILNSLSPEGKTSMLQDVEAKRKTEVEMLAGTIISLGKELKIPTPVNEMFYNQIKVYEKRFVL